MYSFCSIARGEVDEIIRYHKRMGEKRIMPTPRSGYADRLICLRHRAAI
jgi:hypothetical protein